MSEKEEVEKAKALHREAENLVKDWRNLRKSYIHIAYGNIIAFIFVLLIAIYGICTFNLNLAVIEVLFLPPFIILALFCFNIAEKCQREALECKKLAEEIERYIDRIEK